MANPRTLTPRDEALLKLLSRTPATTPLIVKASSAFPEGAFRDERRARERLQALAASGFCRAFPLAQAGGGLMNYYKATVAGMTAVLPGYPLPHKNWFGPIAPTRLQHTLELADVIVHTFVASHRAKIAVSRFHREGELTLTAGQYSQQPDCTFQFLAGGRVFNVLFEIDRSTESVDSPYGQSIRNKLLGYEAYQDSVWQQWKARGERGVRPYFRVVFLTRSIERAYHILTLAETTAKNPDRRLCYAATQESFLASSDALREPLFLDHHGHWQALANPHPTSAFRRQPVRLPKPIEPQLVLC